MRISEKIIHRENIIMPTSGIFYELYLVHTNIRYTAESFNVNQEIILTHSATKGPLPIQKPIAYEQTHNKYLVCGSFRSWELINSINSERVAVDVIPRTTDANQVVAFSLVNMFSNLYFYQTKGSSTKSIQKIAEYINNNGSAELKEIIKQEKSLRALNLLNNRKARSYKTNTQSLLEQKIEKAIKNESRGFSNE